MQTLLRLLILLALLWPGAGWAAISVRTTSNGSGAGTGTAAGISVTEPSGCSSGDLLVAMVHTEGVATSLTRPSGWTNLFNGTSNETQFDYDISYVVRGGSAPSLAWTWTTSAYYEYIIVCLSGQHATPMDNTGSFATAFSGIPDPPSITPNTSDALAVVFAMSWCGSGTGGYTAPTNYTRVYSATGWNTSIAYRQLASASAEDPGAWSNITNCGSNIGHGTITIATGAGGGDGGTVPRLMLMGVGP